MLSLDRRPVCGTASSLSENGARSAIIVAEVSALTGAAVSDNQARQSLARGRANPSDAPAEPA